jgi:hypothetical protein
VILASFAPLILRLHPLYIIPSWLHPWYAPEETEDGVAWWWAIVATAASLLLVGGAPGVRELLRCQIRTQAAEEEGVLV